MKIQKSKNIVLFSFDIEGYSTSSALLLMPNKNIVIDTFASPLQAEEIIAFLKNENRFHYPTWVINTHHHWDHVWGNCAFKNSPIVAHNLCREALISSGNSTLVSFQQKNNFYRSVRLVLPNITFQKTLSIHDQEINLELLHFPSHTEDCILPYLPSEQLIFAGDALEFPFPMLEFSGGTQTYIKNLESLLKLDLKTVIPGHGQVSNKSLIVSNLHYINTVLIKASDAYKSGTELKTLFDLDIEIFLNNNVDLRASDYETHKRNLSLVYEDLKKGN